MRHGRTGPGEGGSGPGPAPEPGDLWPGAGGDWELWAEDDFDTPEEVEAVFRAQRRLSFLYGTLFFLVTLTLPVLHSTWDYWVKATVWGGFTLAYLAVTLLYPLFYILLAVAYTIQANRLEEALLGRPEGGRAGAGVGGRARGD
ncbi:hypothetical protein [Caldinitratiruptor microaerophilus]|uniref:DUF485 domain-containing protein n=1 Tax=Caldinitratiruptor microaerophilus TaxID=671077 RepID=A0AA35CNZ5_9FIRM|nr:hypothetical protein [Caldinitratiruptor microaerophilus]BDG62079.1 hypothetical protein caldi_31690 [Caldinitratiruptor microaerophilus]